MPETNEGNAFDENGICRACVSAEQKNAHQLEGRFSKLREIVDNIKADAAEKNLPYDCIVPISGEKTAFPITCFSKGFEAEGASSDFFP